MAIDRTNYNALVDDDGSNLVGSVIDKNKIKTVILDPVDAAIVAQAAPSVCEGRLTLTTGVPITTADVTGATNIFFTPFRGNRVALYDGISAWVGLTFTEKTLALGVLTNDLPYDVFAYNNAGVVALELLAWTSKTARATAFVLQDGVFVKAGATTRRYLGTFHTTSTTTTEDSNAKRFLDNYYNKVPRVLRRLETTATWNYTLNAFRQANGSALNQVEIIQGVAETPIDLGLLAAGYSDAAGRALTIAIGEDSTTVGDAAALGGEADSPAANTAVTIAGKLNKLPAIGYHKYTWLEKSTAVGTTTWYGTQSAANTGLSGSKLG